MKFSRKLLASALATMAVLATTAAASAAPAVATGNVNVRSGPGTGYAVVDTLARGQQVDIQYCRGSWCFVEKRGPDGWVSSNYLSSGRPGWTPPPPPPPVYDPRPPRPPQWNPNPRPPQWNPNPRPPRPPHWNPNPRPPVYPVQPGNPGSSVCFNGPNGYFCIGD